MYAFDYVFPRHSFLVDRRGCGNTIPLYAPLTPRKIVTTRGNGSYINFHLYSDFSTLVGSAVGGRRAVENRNTKRQKSLPELSPSHTTLNLKP